MKSFFNKVKKIFLIITIIISMFIVNFLSIYCGTNLHFNHKIEISIYETSALAAYNDSLINQYNRELDSINNRINDEIKSEYDRSIDN